MDFCYKARPIVVPCPVVFLLSPCLSVSPAPSPPLAVPLMLNLDSCIADVPEPRSSWGALAKIWSVCDSRSRNRKVTVQLRRRQSSHNARMQLRDCTAAKDETVLPKSTAVLVYGWVDGYERWDDKVILMHNVISHSRQRKLLISFLNQILL